MMCQECGEKPAVVLFTQIVNNEKKTVYLCKQCAEKKGFSVSFSGGDPLSEMIKETSSEEAGQEENVKCPSCGLSYAEFKKGGRLGCGDCYTAFSDRLEVLLRRIHGSTRHTGKVPLRASREVKLKRDILQLREKLNAAIENEEFEEAARLRDKITEMEKAAEP